MVKAQARPEKESFILVKFYYGDSLGVQSRYTDWDQSYLGYTSEPRMKITIPENEGTFGKRELRIELPEDAFTTRASSGVPHSPIFVVVQEVTQGLFTGDQNSQDIRYTGRIVRTIKNFQGKNGRVAFMALPVKSRLDISMGLPANHQCAWNLFNGHCGVNFSLHFKDTSIDSRDGQEITITDAAVAALASDDRYWKRGYVEKDGLRISIRDYDGSVDVTKFQLARGVPLDWVGGTGDIRIVAGCDKSVEICRSRFNAEEFFIGLGYAIPAYNPLFEGGN